MRAPGITLHKLPLFGWAIFVTAILLLLSLPVLAGGMLLFGYTFAGRLWLSLGYDEEGFEPETVKKWWEGVLNGINEFLLD